MSGESICLEAKRSGSTLQLALVGSATIATARELRKRLLEELVPTCDASIALDRVTRMDAAGVQLLLAARGWLVRHGRDLTLVASEGPATRALQASGARFDLAPRAASARPTEGVT
jgi:anti-anti-sigma regulatory factor